MAGCCCQERWESSSPRILRQDFDRDYTVWRLECVIFVAGQVACMWYKGRKQMRIVASHAEHKSNPRVPGRPAVEQGSQQSSNTSNRHRVSAIAVAPSTNARELGA